MELNKTYLQSEYKIKFLPKGTIIQVHFENKDPEFENDLLMITEINHDEINDYRIFNRNGSLVVAISLKTATGYLEGHRIYSYEVKRI